MKAKMNFPTYGIVSECNTWATLCSGDVFVTNTVPVPCIEEPLTCPFVYDGPQVDVWQGQYEHNGIDTTKQTLALFFKVIPQGMNLQAHGFGQCYHQCLESLTHQQLVQLLTLLDIDLDMEVAAMGRGMVEHSPQSVFPMPPIG